MCLAQGHKPVRLEPAAPRSRVKHSTTELPSLAKTCDFQQGGILTCVDSDEPVQPPFKLRNFKLCLASSLTVIEYSSV